MSQPVTCGCGEVFTPEGDPAGQVRCPRCFRPVIMPAAPGMLGYMGPSTGGATMTPRAIELLGQTSLWVRIMAILMFVGAGLMLLAGCALFLIGVSSSGRTGAGAVLGCVYIPFALLYIVPALFLWRYATHSKMFSIKRDEVSLEQAIQAQKSFWKFVAVTALVILGIYLLMLGLAVASAAMHFP